LIVTVDDNHPVGLLFAGSSVHTIANPIQAALDSFSVTMAQGTPDDEMGSGTGSDPDPSPTMSAFLSGTGMRANRNFWSAAVTVSVTIVEVPRSAASGATVAGSWSTGGTVSAVTGDDGTVTVSSGNLRSNVSSVTFTLTEVSHPAYELASDPLPSVTIDQPQ
jgi:hypothetical protein